MFSKEEVQRIKREFWVAFSEENSRKWLLYNTKIKDVAFKFYVDNKKAQVLLEIEPKDNENRLIYFEKIESLKTILLKDFLPDAVFERNLYLENGKAVSRIWVEKSNVSCNNKNTWPEVFEFFNDKMDAFERFFYEYEDYIKDLKINS
ncbi:DUF4268 domain-containing protein [uncultured Flavobacterium sp.]|uniref:DUF4268 domain-containing protein n=1 Tax=uncultured Flavobacterium sp. TaxID=165435 RepID=UPI0030CA57E4